MYNIQQKIKNWDNELQEYKKYDYSNKLKNYDTIKDCTINFFLNDWKKHNEINDEYKTNYDYSFCLTIYANGEVIIEEYFGENNNYSDYIDSVEECAKYLPFVYLEIANIALCDEDGYGRFWCNVNDKTYYMEYKEDWNDYIDYKSLNKEEWYANEDKRHKNHEMFKRWDKIRPLMGSDFIHIAIVHANDQEELGINRDDLYLIKAFDKNIENYFDWIATDKVGDTESVNGGCTNYKDLIQLKTNIEWINIELLENLEELYDLN